MKNIKSKASISNILIGLLLIFGFSACGVKGDPMPPGTPAEIGRGKPSFHETAESNVRKPPLALPKKTKDTDDDTND